MKRLFATFYIFLLSLLVGCSPMLPNANQVTELEKSKWKMKNNLMVQLIKPQISGTTQVDEITKKLLDSMNIGNVVVSNFACATAEIQKTAKCSYRVSVQIISGQSELTKVIEDTRKDIGFVYAKDGWTFSSDDNDGLTALAETRAKSGIQAEQPSEQTPEVKPVREWKYSQAVDRMDGGVTHHLIVEAEETTNGGAYLQLQCTNTKSYLIIIGTQKMVDYGGSSTVRFRAKFDDLTAENFVWPMLQGSKGAGSNDSTGVFTRRLAKASKLMIEIPRYEAVPDVYTFNLPDNGEKFLDVLQPCGKKFNLGKPTSAAK